VASADFVSIAVATSPGEDGSANLHHVLAVAEAIAKRAAREIAVATKSTIAVGTVIRSRPA
jgi:UDPglucose 6-dehydrogenase